MENSYGILFFMAFLMLPAIFATGTDSNCRDKVSAFLRCVNKTITTHKSGGSKMQMLKNDVNQCLKRNKCKEMFDSSRSYDVGQAAVNNSQPPPSGFACMKALRERAGPAVERCVLKTVPDAIVEVRRKGAKENLWRVLQQATNRTVVRNLCQNDADANDALTCVKQVFSPTERHRKRQEEKFNKFCSAARSCRVGMGVCRTVLDNGRKAICACESEVIHDLENISRDVPECDDAAREFLRNNKPSRGPFNDDCGPDPCDLTFARLTKDGDTNLNDDDGN